MVAKLDARDLAAALSDVLDRRRRGERFIVERDGTQVALLFPLIDSHPLRDRHVQCPGV
jgi:antitoxin (DNA-binding transcriptional repressor) of toxin-antitoxin stability system